MRQRAPKVGFVSLGCPKALVDSERILTQLLYPPLDGLGPPPPTRPGRPRRPP